MTTERRRSPALGPQAVITLRSESAFVLPAGAWTTIPWGEAGSRLQLDPAPEWFLSISVEFDATWTEDSVLGLRLMADGRCISQTAQLLGSDRFIVGYEDTGCFDDEGVAMQVPLYGELIQKREQRALDMSIFTSGLIVPVEVQAFVSPTAGAFVGRRFVQAQSLRATASPEPAL